MSARTRNLLLGALSLAVIAVTFFVVLPKIANYRDVWDVVSDLDPIWLVAFGVGVVLNVVTFAPPWMITLPGLRFVQALLFTQASTAFTYIAPGGGIVGMAGSYGLLRAWGFESGPVARAVALTGVWNQLANLVFPVVGGAHALDRGAAGRRPDDRRRGGRHRLRRRGRRAGAGLLERAARSRHRPRRRRGRRTGSSGRSTAGRSRAGRNGLAEFRNETVKLVRRRWWLLTIATVAGNLAVFAIFIISLRAVGIGASEVTWIEAFAGWSLAASSSSSRSRPVGSGPWSSA